MDAILALFSLSGELREVDCFGILLESLFCALLGLVVTSPSSFIVGGDTLSFVPKLEVTTYAFVLVLKQNTKFETKGIHVIIRKYV